MSPDQLSALLTLAVNHYDHDFGHGSKAQAAVDNVMVTAFRMGLVEREPAASSPSGADR